MAIKIPAATPAGRVLCGTESLLASGDDCLVRMGDTAREFGELCTEVSKDLGDGKISDNELARINRQRRADGQLARLMKRNAANKGRAD